MADDNLVYLGVDHHHHHHLEFGSDSVVEESVPTMAGSATSASCRSFRIPWTVPRRGQG